MPSFIRNAGVGDWVLFSVSFDGPFRIVNETYLKTKLKKCKKLLIIFMLQVFKGCNQDSPLDVVLNHLPISTWGTRGVRFYVHTWHRRSCLRVEVYGYDPFRGKFCGVVLLKFQRKTKKKIPCSFSIQKRLTISRCIFFPF